MLQRVVGATIRRQRRLVSLPSSLPPTPFGADELSAVCAGELVAGAAAAAAAAVAFATVPAGIFDGCILSRSNVLQLRVTIGCFAAF